MGLIHTRASTAREHAAGELIEVETRQLKAGQPWYRQATVSSAIVSSLARRAARQDREAGKP